jgi:NHL repeat
MKISRSTFGALAACAALSLLAACSSATSQTAPPMTSQQSVTKHIGSWMSPDAKKRDLLYVTDEGNYHVYVYDYPSGKLVGTLDAAYGSPTGLCVDKKGHIFVTEYNGQEVLEFAHGGTTPIASLYDPGQPIGCAIDSKTGNLAVANEMSPSGGYGNIAIFAKAKGTATTYTDWSAMELPYWLSYDNAGNLFIDGEFIQSGFRFVFVELTPGSSGKFTTLSMQYPPGSPNGVQWNGKYITLGSTDGMNGLIFQLTLSGSQLTVVGTTQLSGYSRMPTYWIDGTTVIATSGGDFGFFKYPAGGSPTKSFTQNWPWAAVVSKK